MKFSMFSPLFTTFFVASCLLPEYVSAHEVIYLFHGAVNCSVYDHALIRAGSKVAYRMSMYTQTDNNVADSDFHLNEYDAVVPFITINYLSVEELKVEYSIENDDLELLMFGKHVMLEEGNPVPEEWAAILAGDDGEEEANRFLRERNASSTKELNGKPSKIFDSRDSRELSSYYCRQCQICECCNDLLSTCYSSNARMLTGNSNDRNLQSHSESKIEERARLLADIARPVFDVMNIPCLQGNFDIEVLIF